MTIPPWHEEPIAKRHKREALLDTPLSLLLPLATIKTALETAGKL